VGVLHGLDRVFSRESPHHQGQLTIGCRLDGKSINPQHVLRGMSAAAVHFHNKLDVFHGSFQVLRSVLAANMNLNRLGLGVEKNPSGSVVS